MYIYIYVYNFLYVSMLRCKSVIAGGSSVDICIYTHSGTYSNPQLSDKINI